MGSTNKTMNTFVVFAGLLALATGAPMPTEEVVEAVPALVHAPLGLAPTLIRAPAHDSASIESHRLGGNFAYAIAEAHAFAQVTPQLATITHPVAETTVVHEPASIAHATFQKVQTVTHHVEQPAVVAHAPVFHHAGYHHAPAAAPVAVEGAHFAHHPYAVAHGHGLGHAFAPHVAPAAWSYHH